MKIIKKLCDLIDEEIHDGKKYAKLALKYKDDDKALAEMFYNLSLEEMRHMNVLHNSVVKEIEKVKEEKAGDPKIDGMQVIYDLLH